jgi:translation initiation factor IF-1
MAANGERPTGELAGDRPGGRGPVVDGTVLAVLPQALYRVAVDGGHEVRAHAASGARVNFVRLLVGDRVTVELAPHDAGRGRIVRKLSR